MLWEGDKRIGKLSVGGKAVAVLYVGAVKVWESVSSCFGSGVWREELPWKDADPWKE